jgi:hypothetical protein
MAVINDPTVAANIARVGSVTWTPFHTSAGPFPVGAGGGYRISMPSGVIGAGLASNSELFQFRYTTAASRVCLVHGVNVSACMSLAATAAALLSLRMCVARAWTVNGSGGTRSTLTGNNNKLATSHNTSEVNDIGVATTGALTAGTKTLDAQDIGSVFYDALTGAITTLPSSQLLPSTNLFGEFSGSLGFPLLLANQEGFVVRSGPTGAATMTWGLVVNVLWSEVDAFA